MHKTLPPLLGSCASLCFSLYLDWKRGIEWKGTCGGENGGGLAPCSLLPLRAPLPFPIQVVGRQAAMVSELTDSSMDGSSVRLMGRLALPPPSKKLQELVQNQAKTALVNLDLFLFISRAFPAIFSFSILWKKNCTSSQKCPSQKSVYSCWLLYYRPQKHRAICGNSVSSLLLKFLFLTNCTD